MAKLLTLLFLLPIFYIIHWLILTQIYIRLDGKDLPNFKDAVEFIEHNFGNYIRKNCEDQTFPSLGMLYTNRCVKYVQSSIIAFPFAFGIFSLLFWIIDHYCRD